jgi:hypothetical protein
MPCPRLPASETTDYTGCTPPDPIPCHVRFVSRRFVLPIRGFTGVKLEYPWGRHIKPANALGLLVRRILTIPIFMGHIGGCRLAMKEPSMSTTKTTLEMSQTLFRRAKATAASRGQTLKQLVTGALEKELGLSEPNFVASASRALRMVRQLAKLNADSWQTDHDSVAAVREQRRG